MAMTTTWVKITLVCGGGNAGEATKQGEDIHVIHSAIGFLFTKLNYCTHIVRCCVWLLSYCKTPPRGVSHNNQQIYIGMTCLCLGLLFVVFHTSTKHSSDVDRDCILSCPSSAYEIFAHDSSSVLRGN